MRFVHDTRDAKGLKRDYDKGLQVICAGLPRCATSSLQAAMEDNLGFGPCMHFAYIAADVSQLKLVHAALMEDDKDKRQAILHQIFDGYLATADFPGMAFLDDLIEMYPDAKVVLNRRQTPEQWAASISGTIKFLGSKPFAALTCLWPTNYWNYQIHETFKWRIRQRRGGVNVFGTGVYDGHLRFVRDLCKRKGKDYFEWEPTMGWEGMCKFLDKPVPSVPFPRVNDTATMKKMAWFLAFRGLVAWMFVFSLPFLALRLYNKLLTLLA